MLRHLARGASKARALVLVTFRDTDAEMPDTLAEALADLRRSEGVVRIRVTGLSEDEVTDFVKRASEGQLGSELLDLAAAISELTGGNAFLVCELWRALVETGGFDAIAHSRLRRASSRSTVRAWCSPRRNTGSCRSSPSTPATWSRTSTC